MAWTDERRELLNAGFSEPEIVEEGDRMRGEMQSAGFEQPEVDEYFGTREPDMQPVRELIQRNLANRPAGAPPAGAEPREADSFLEHVQAGLQMSSGHMAFKALQGKSVTPDMLAPSDASTFYRAASGVATFAGDLPAMMAGSVLGGAFGGGVGTGLAPGPGTAVGTVLGAGAGGFAMPTAIREVLMQYYEKGDIKDFKDFWERTSSVLLDTTKSSVIGAATLGVGKGVGGKLAATSLAPAVSRVATASSEVATMVAVGKGLEGEMPSAQDFTDAAILVGGLHFAIKAPGKLREIYAKTGVKPAEVLQEAQTNPVVMQELLNEANSIPKMYEAMAEVKPAVTSIEPAKIEPRELTSRDKILSRIGDKADKPVERYSKDQFYREFVDKLDPIKLAVEQLGGDVKALTAKDNPYKLARMANDYKAKTQHFFENGTLDFRTLEKTGKSFNEIIEPVKSELDGLKSYMISKRVVELEGRGLKHGFDVEAAKNEITLGREKFEAIANETVDFQNKGLKYLKDSGVISAESMNHMQKANKAYISFKRIVEPEQGSGKSSKSPIKKYKGSERMIQDPFISMIDNMEVNTKFAEKNRAVKSLVDMAAKNSDQTLFVKEKTPIREVKIHADEMVKGMVANGYVTRESFGKNIKEKMPGITEKAIDKAFAKEVEAGNAIDATMIEGFSIYRGSQKDLAPNQFEVFRDGKREVYTTEPALAEAIKILDGNGTAQNIVFRMARGITSVKRLGISLMPDFILRNFIRDQVTASTFSKTGPAPLLDTMYAMGDLIKKNDTYYKWLKGGGANGAFLELSEKYINENVYKLDKNTGFVDRTWNLVTKPMHYLELAGQLAEQATRLAEAKRVMGQASKGAPIFEAGFASRESTIDFQRMGSKIAATNMITAFQNASIQGLDRSIRAVKEDPKALTMRAATYITAPSILLWWANKDDERVKEIPQWQKDLNWIVATDNWVKEAVDHEADQLPPHLVRTRNGIREINKGVIYKLPKPQELGLIFGTLPERILDGFFTDNPDAFADFGETMTNLITPAFLPDAVTPMFEQYANKNTFTDGKLVPGHLEGIMPQYQYTDYTSETGRALGKLVMTVPGIRAIGSQNAKLGSPMVIENYIRSWSGSMGMYALQLADKGIEAAGLSKVAAKPTASVSDIPFVKAFVVRNPSAGSKSMIEFDKIHDENKMVIDTIKSLAKRGNLSEAEMLMNDRENQAKMANLSGVKDALSNQAAFIQKVYQNPDLTADEKRQIIDGVYYGMTETAKAGLTFGREMKKELQQQHKGE